MAFDFPDNPAVGDEYVSGGVKYTWTGLVWDLAGMDAALDYVQTAGDVMTGTLTINYPAVITARGDPADLCGRVELQGGSTDRTGLIGFFKPRAAAADPEVRLARLGWGTATELELMFENGCTSMKVAGGSILIANGRLAFANFAQPAGSEHLLTRHIDLYGGTFGFSISSGTLNHVVPAANIHAFKCGTETVVDIRADGMRIPGGNLSVTGTGSFSGNVSIRDNDKFDLSNGYTIQKVSGVQKMLFHGGQSSAYFTFHITGFGDAFTIDKVGSTGNSVNVTSPEALALATELKVGRRKAEDIGDSVDVVKMLAALLVKIKKLEAEVTTLKARK